MRRLTTVLLFAITALIGGATPGLADPGRGSGQSTFPMVCEGDVWTLTVGNGSWAAADVAETGRKFIPKATHFLIEDESETILFAVHDEKKVAGKGPGATCVDEFELDGMRYRFVVEGKLRGSGGVGS
jgi:hypothetical protein